MFVFLVWLEQDFIWWDNKLLTGGERNRVIKKLSKLTKMRVIHGCGLKVERSQYEREERKVPKEYNSDKKEELDWQNWNHSQIHWKTELEKTASSGAELYIWCPLCKWPLVDNREDVIIVITSQKALKMTDMVGWSLVPIFRSYCSIEIIQRDKSKVRNFRLAH